LPLGYTTGTVNGEKRVIIDETQRDAVNAIFDAYERTQSIGAALKAAMSHGVHTWDKSVRKMFQNTIYKGEFHDVAEYCEPYLTPERWERIRQMSEQRHYTPPAHKRGYIFSTLVRCADCGGSMVGKTNTLHGKEYSYYACKRSSVGTCSHRKLCPEKVIEDKLIASVDEVLSEFTAEVKPKRQKQKNLAPIRAKLNRLKELYIDGDISKEDYTKRKEALEAELNAPVQRSEAFRNAFPDGWQKYYDEAPNTAKNAAWRSVVRQITVDAENNIAVEFLPFQ